jgi:DNA (cytosine-5)-methyltransferase 1
MSGERSSLILEAIRLIKECRPDFFIWENVKGTFSSNNRQDFAAILQAFTNIGGYRLEWQLLNTKWFLPQNRERVYLVGYLGDGSRGQIFPIGEGNKSTNELQGQQGNTCTLTTRYGADGNGSYITERKQYAQIKTNNSKGFETITEGDSLNYSNPNSKTRRGRVGKGVAQTLDTGCEQAVIAAMRGRNPDNPSDRSKGAPLKQTLEINNEGVSNALTRVQKDNYVVSGTLRTHKDGRGFREIKDGDSPCIPARAREDGSGQPIIGIENTIRRLTPIECERLQGFPDNWTKVGSEGSISDTQRYKMCGNAVTVDVVKAVGKRIKDVVYG